MEDKLKLFILSNCPYCVEVLGLIKTLKSEVEKYKDIEITIIDEQKDSAMAAKFDYYYVPSFYLGQTKLHEGAAAKNKVAAVFDKYLSR